MKKYFSFLAVLFSAIVISSCSDTATDEGSSSPVIPSDTTNVAEYTICMYATGGTNLDFSIVYELLDNIDEVSATNGKVRFVGIYKPSQKFQKPLGEDGGTRYFELAIKDSVTHSKVLSDLKKMTDTFEQDPNDISLSGILSDQTFVNDLVGEKYAESDFQMYEPENIAKALQYLTKKAPAKKYILVTNNHGGGWKFSDEQPLNSTRAMVYDDCLGNRGISLDEFNAGVEQSGIKFDVLFCDLCLMGHLENLYGYSQNFPICIASAETTTGSKVGLLAKRLADLGGDATHDQLFNECSDWVTTADTTIGYRKWETYADIKSKTWEEFQDMGCYDLTKIGNLTAPLTDITNWFTNALSDNQLKYVIEKSVLTTLYTTLPVISSLETSFVREDAIAYINSQYGRNDMTADTIADKLLEGDDLFSLFKTNASKEVSDFYLYQSIYEYGYPMAYFVWNTERIAKQYNMTKEAGELEKLLNNYMDALKSMCRIKCSHDDFPGCTYDGIEYPAMDAYLWTSPTVVIASLSTAGYVGDNRLDMSPWALKIQNKGLTLDKSLAAYQNTKFDQLTNWSKVLQGIDVNPCVVTNTFREIPVFYGKFGKVSVK